MSSQLRLLYVGQSHERESLLAGLTKQFALAREVDGESAWQKLVVDQDIALVLLEADIGRLSVSDLLARLHASRLARLRNVPVVLFLPEDSDEARNRAKADGVNEAVTGDIRLDDLQAKLARLLAMHAPAVETTADLIQDPVTGLFSARYVELQLAQAMSHAARHGSEVSILVMGFDRWSETVSALGADRARQLLARFASMLAGKIRKEDTFGQWADGQFAIVSPGTSPVLCLAFAERIREAVQGAKVVIQGQVQGLSASLGLASVPFDKASSAGALMLLAADRMRLAQAAGGNQVVSQLAGLAAAKTLGVTRALECVKAGQVDRVKQHLPQLAVELLPLLRLMQEDLQLRFPLEEIEKGLSGRQQQN